MADSKSDGEERVAPLPVNDPCSGPRRQKASLCERHEWSSEEHGGEDWNLCAVCGFRELWAGGTLIASSNWSESNRLDGWSLG